MMTTAAACPEMARSGGLSRIPRFAPGNSAEWRPVASVGLLDLDTGTPHAGCPLPSLSVKVHSLRASLPTVLQRASTLGLHRSSRMDG